MRRLPTHQMVPVPKSEWKGLCEALDIDLGQVDAVRSNEAGHIQVLLIDGSVEERVNSNTVPDLSGRMNEAGGHDRPFIDAMKGAL